MIIKDKDIYWKELSAMKKSEIIREMSKIYNERVMYFLNEDTVYDKHGNNIIQKAIGLKVFEKETGYRYHIGGYHKENGKECIILLNPDQPNPSANLETGDQVLSDDYNDIRNPDGFKEDLGNIGSVNINDLKKGTYILVPISEFDKKYTYKRKK